MSEEETPENPATPPPRSIPKELEEKLKAFPKGVPIQAILESLVGGNLDDVDVVQGPGFTVASISLGPPEETPGSKAELRNKVCMLAEDLRKVTDVPEISSPIFYASIQLLSRQLRSAGLKHGDQEIVLEMEHIADSIYLEKVLPLEEKHAEVCPHCQPMDLGKQTQEALENIERTLNIYLG
jgi:hypothetical protein